MGCLSRADGCAAATFYGFASFNHSTSQAEVERALELVATLAVDSAPGPLAPMPETYPTIEAGWLRRPLLDTETLRSLARFASLDVEQAERILGSAHEHHAAAGEAVVEQWQVSRDLFVILIGTVEVSDDGNAVASLGPADFFGELAAIDWGAGFARTRSATVTATEPTRLPSSTGFSSTG